MKVEQVRRLLLLVGMGVGAWASTSIAQERRGDTHYPTDTPNKAVVHDERPSDPWMAGPPRPLTRAVAEPSIWTRGPWRSIQVNVDALGQDILGDAANEPSIAIDPTDPCRMAIGWRQFDTVESSFRQAGWAYSHDAGETWTFTGSLAPGTFGSDPVLDSDADGVFYYLSLLVGEHRLFRSVDGGVTWDRLPADGLAYADKPWMAIDRTTGIGRGNIYVLYGNQLRRSTDGGETFVQATEMAHFWQGTATVGPAGELYTTSTGASKSVNAQDPQADPTFEYLIGFYNVGPCLPGRQIDDAPSASADTRVGGGACGIRNQVSVATDHWRSPCDGLGCQPWIATDHSAGPNHGNVYVVFCGCLSDFTGMGQIVFVRSTDGGVTWDPPRRLNEDPPHEISWRWFNTMSVAPNGRIDVVWNLSDDASAPNLAEMFYSYSTDAGETWSKNLPVSPMFDSCIGYPYDNNKLGDYYHMISDNAVGNLAYAATFNGTHDIYFLRVGDCNDNGLHDSRDLADGTAYDCNENALLDECERGDADGNEQIKLRDFADFANCFTGSCNESPCSPPLYLDPCCGIMDFDTDGDIDPTDFAAFHEAFNP